MQTTTTGARGDASGSRRSFIRKAGVAAGAAWVAPTILSSPAAASGTQTIDCDAPGYTTGYFSWGWLPYADLQRSGAPGVGDVLTAPGWTGHPTYTTYCAALATRCSGGTSTGVTIGYRLLGNPAFLNLTADGQATGVRTNGNAVPWWAFRIAKDNQPAVGDSAELVIQFSEPVLCPRVEIGDADAALPVNTFVGPTAPVNCTGAAAPAGDRWADRVSASAWTGLDQTGPERVVSRVDYLPGQPQPPNRATPYGDNIFPPVPDAPAPPPDDYWFAGECIPVPQTQERSTFLLQAQGLVQELRIDFLSGFQATGAATGRQHIGVGNIDFGYIP